MQNSETLEEVISSELTAKRKTRTRSTPDSPVDNTSAEGTSEDGSWESHRERGTIASSNNAKTQRNGASKAKLNSKSPSRLKNPLRKPSPNSKQDSRQANSTSTLDPNLSADTIVETDEKSNLEDQERTNPFFSERLNDEEDIKSDSGSSTGFVFEMPDTFTMDYDMEKLAKANFKSLAIGFISRSCSAKCG